MQHYCWTHAMPYACSIDSAFKPAEPILSKLLCGVFRHCCRPFQSTLKVAVRNRRASSTRTMAASEDIKQWPKQDNRRFLHAVYRVGNMEATCDYYTKHFGMKQLRYRDVPDVSRCRPFWLNISLWYIPRSSQHNSYYCFSHHTYP